MMPMRTPEALAPLFFAGTDFFLAIPYPRASANLDVDHHRFKIVFALAFAQITGRSPGFVAEDYQPLPAHDLRKPLPLVVQRRERVQIVTHDPGKRYVRRCGDQV